MTDMHEWKEYRASQDITTELWTGRQLTRIFSATRGDVPLTEDALDDECELGSVLLSKYGGPDDALVQSPRLQSRVWRPNKKTMKVELVTQWVMIDVDESSADVTDYGETTRSQTETDRQYEKVMRYVAVTTSKTHASIPVIGQTTALVVPTAITDYVCRSVRVVDEWQYGRYLIVAEFAKMKAQISY